MLTDLQIDRARRLAMRLAGIELMDRHGPLLESRSHRLGIGGGAEFDALLDLAERGDARAGRQFIRLVTTKFTGFFRHPRHFEIAAEHAVGAIAARGAARLWSAAASTGEEPYSLAMAIIERCDPGHHPAAAILATDIDAEALALAARGEYGEGALASLGRGRRERFFPEPAGAGRWRISGDARRLIEFRQMNLADVAWPIEGPFDAVYCRNVLMYMEGCYRYAIVERIASLIAPDGLLILDPAEHLGRADHWFDPTGGGVYRRRRVAADIPGRARAWMARGRKG